MSQKEIEEKRQELSHRVFIHMLEILAIFGIPAIGAYFAGDWLDSTYDMRPYGSVLAGVVALTISWLITVQIYKKIKQGYEDLEKEQEELEQNKTLDKNE